MKKIIIINIIFIYILQIIFPILKVEANSNNKIPKNPKLVHVIENNVELESIDGYEYSKDGIVWQDSPKFDLLEPLTEYNFVQRIKASNYYDSSIISEPLIVKTNTIVNISNIPDDYVAITDLDTYKGIINNRSRKYILMLDIDFEKEKSKYIGFGGTFNGIFNGNGHCLKNGEVTGTSALFHTNNGTIIGLGIINAHWAQNISSSSTEKQVKEMYCFAENNNGLIKDCYTSVSDYTKYKNLIFGIAKYNNGNIIECYSDVNSFNHSGAIARENSTTGIINKCYNSGHLTKIDDASDIGGIVEANLGIVENSYNTGIVRGGFAVTGGIVGCNKGLVRNCNNKALIESYGISGGISGKNIKYNTEDIGIIEQSYNYGAVNGTINSAGIAGENYGIIKNCYNKGKLSENSSGIAYINGGNISECLNIGEAKFGISSSKKDFKSPFENYVGSVNNCYYLYGTELEEQSGTKILKEELKKQSLYNGFDFISIWKLKDNFEHPILINQKNIIEIELVTESKIVVKPNNNSLYSINGINYQSSNEFCNLLPNTLYKIYQKDNTSNTVYQLNVKTDKYTPINSVLPEIDKIGSSYIQLKAVDGYEYSIDGSIWQDYTYFGHLKAVTEYTLYQRIKNTDISYSSNKTEIKIKTPKKDSPYLKSTPQLESSTSTSVILKASSLYEYSIDGNIWQDSNIFNDLNPNTEYTFYERSKETIDTKAGEIGDALIVRTPKNEPPNPILPEIEYKTKTTIIIKHIPGYEYKINNMDFQDSTIFDNLDPNTEYNVYQRYKETDTTKSGIITCISVITNDIVIFEADGASCDVRILDLNNKRLNSIPLATKEGYEFLGWYTEKDGGEKMTLDTLFENSSVVYAHFIKAKMIGDITGDGKINGKDWNRLYEHINETNLLTEEEFERADVNKDGKVNGKDWNRLYEHINETNPLF